MPLFKKQPYTSEDYWNLPDGQRAELIDGQLYDMAPPNRIYQKLVHEISRAVGNHIAQAGGACEVYPAPFAVNLDAKDKDWVEPDISVICDKDKLTDRGCSGAPDWIVEIVSPSSRRMDYSIRTHCILELAFGNTGSSTQPRNGLPFITMMRTMRLRSPYLTLPSKSAFMMIW